MSASAAARRVVARAVGRPVGAALFLGGAGWALGLFGLGDMALLPLAVGLGAFGLAMLLVGKDATATA